MKNKIEIGVKVDTGLDPNQQGWDTQKSLIDLFERCLQIQEEKGAAYGEAWREQGWMGNLARIMSKSARLKNMLWKDVQFRDGESAEETLIDLINLCGFMLLNLRDGNKWGERR